MNKRSVGIDADGVFVDFDTDWRMQYIKDFGIAPSAPTTMWDFPTHITHFNTDAEFWKWLSTTQVWMKPKVNQNDLDALRRYQTDFDLHLITTKPDWAIQRTLEWIATLRVAWKGIHVGTFPKGEVMLDAYVDDAPHNLEDYYKTHPDAEIYKYEQAYNKDAVGTPVRSLREMFLMMKEV